MSFTLVYLVLTLTNIRNQVAKAHQPSQPASQLAKQPGGRPAKTFANGGTASEASQRSTQPASRPRPKPKLSPAGRPAGRGSYTRLAGRPAGINTDWPASRARNSRPSSPRSLILTLRSFKIEVFLRVFLRT